MREISSILVGGVSLFFAFVARDATSHKRHTRVMRSSESKRGSGGLGAVPSNKQGASRARDALLAKEQINYFGLSVRMF